MDKVTNPSRHIVEKAIEAMSPDQQEHFKLVIAAMALSYINPDSRGLILLQEGSALQLMTINANEFDVIDVLRVATEYVNAAALEDAPAKEMFN